MNDLELYNACLRYCKAFGEVAVHEAQYERAKFVRDRDEWEQMREHIKYDEERLERYYNDLYNIVNNNR